MNIYLHHIHHRPTVHIYISMTIASKNSSRNRSFIDSFSVLLKMLNQNEQLKIITLGLVNNPIFQTYVNLEETHSNWKCEDKICITQM